jgi:E3 ubiquitin-protein ligase HUWE1
LEDSKVREDPFGVFSFSLFTVPPFSSSSLAGLLSYSQGQLLKNILRATQRLMQTSGTTEGLRNLIDTSLLSSVKLVMSHRVVFGPQIFSSVTNIAATFVHNEPTSLTTLQEADVPKTFYDSLDEAIPASNDVLQAIPNAIGAFCLNSTGLNDFTSRPLIASYFSIFTSPSHTELLRDRDSALVMGTAIDELIRHHPTLRERVKEAIMEVFGRLKEMGEKFERKEGEEGYGLLLAGQKEAKELKDKEEKEKEEKGKGKEGEAMSVDAPAVPSAVAAAGTGAGAPEEIDEEERKRREKEKQKEEDFGKENEVTIAIDVFGRVRLFLPLFSILLSSHRFSYSSSRASSRTSATLPTSSRKNKPSTSSSTFSPSRTAPPSCRKTVATRPSSPSSASPAR